jgi:threonine/homoserine/homoserine lactone efflux protein
VRHGWRAGVFTALGIAAGNTVHIAYVNIGLGALIAHSIVAFNVMKFIAAAYLAWIGFKALQSKPSAGNGAGARMRTSMADGKAFRRGLVTCLLNPKAALFWLSFFTLVIDPAMPADVLTAFCCVLIASIAAWFSMVAFFLSRAKVRAAFQRMGHWFDRATGAVLIALGVRVALAHR